MFSFYDIFHETYLDRFILNPMVCELVLYLIYISPKLWLFKKSIFFPTSFQSHPFLAHSSTFFSRYLNAHSLLTKVFKVHVLLFHAGYVGNAEIVG